MLFRSQIGVSKAAVTIRISELIEKGLVVKKQSPTDKRVNFLYINQELKAEYDEYDKNLKELSEKIETMYTQEELKIFCKVMNSFSENI